MCCTSRRGPVRRSAGIDAARAMLGVSTDAAVAAPVSWRNRRRLTLSMAESLTRRSGTSHGQWATSRRPAGKVSGQLCQLGLDRLRVRMAELVQDVHRPLVRLAGGRAVAGGGVRVAEVMEDLRLTVRVVQVALQLQRVP